MAIKDYLEPRSGPRVFGYTRWRKDFVKVAGEPTQDRQAWNASVRDVAYSMMPYSGHTGLV